jgi:hypothetical protein
VVRRAAVAARRASVRRAVAERMGGKTSERKRKIKRKRKEKDRAGRA